MSIAHLLEDFEYLTPSKPTAALIESAADSDLLDSFEQGYKAGWEDAVRAKSDERANISADFARNIQNLSFTYHEARGAMIAELSPVIEKAVMTVLPELSRQSIGAQVSEELNTILEENSDIPVLITTSPENYEVVCELLPSDVNLPIDVVRDTNLTEGQVRLQFGQKERQIDLDEVVSVVSSAFAGFTHETQKEIMNG